MFSSLYAQETVEDLNFVNIKDGVSNIAISTIIQDQYGFIWMGTNGVGLNRFDGIDYSVYKHVVNDSTSISSSLVFCSYIDSKKRLWIGTEDGLNLYDRDLDQFKQVQFLTTSTNNSSSVSVGSIIEDVAGDLLIGTYEQGLYKLSTEALKPSKIPFLVKNEDVQFINVNSLQKASNGKIYAGTSLGLKEYDSTTGTLKSTIFNGKNGFETVNDAIETLLIDEQQNYWIGTLTNGVFKIEFDKESSEELYKINHFPISEKRILSMLQVSEDSFLFGTENDGLFHLNAKGKLIHNYLYSKTDKNSIQSNSIWSLFLDSNNRIWVGYYNSGAAKHDKLYDKFNNIESLATNLNSLEVGSVTGIAKDKLGNFWISMDGGGIDILNPKTNVFTKVNSKKRNYISGLNIDDIQTVFIDSKQNVWAGSWRNGLYVLKNGTRNFKNYNLDNTEVFNSNIILSFAEDSKGIIWISTFYGGLLSYNPSTNKFQNYTSENFSKYNIQNSAIRKVLVDLDDNIWLGTTQGLYKVSQLGDNKFSVEDISDKIVVEQVTGISANHILSLYQSKDGILWIGTRGAGLCKYNINKNKAVWYNKSNNLNEENVSGIIESLNGNIWVSGNYGISKLDVNTNIITNYNSDDGLLSNDFNFNAVYRDKTGEIYFGNYKGIDYFNPNNIPVNTNEPSMYLTDFKLFNKPVDLNSEDSPLKKVISETEQITLTHNQSVFTIDYVGINYTRPEKNQYAYYLDGFETDWNYVGNSKSATYTNLPYGDYIFNVKSANNDGVWNKEPLTLAITVLPPWWRTVWAFFLYFVLFLLALYWYSKRIQKRIKEKQLISNEREKRLQEEELHEKKLRFFTNISHEFRTPLTLIMNPIEDIIQTKSLSLPTEVKEKHQIIHKNADRLSKLINELMDFRKLELNKARVKASKIELISFVNELASYFNEEALNREIYLNIEANVETLNVWADPGMLEKIIFNILSNAFKVTNEGGTITICISAKNKSEILPLVNENEPIKAFEISVKDTGPGLEKEQVDKIFERFYQVNSLNQTYYGGTGIGLEVCRSFVELHKGKIEVESTVNVGTIFRVLLPIGKKHFDEAEIASTGNLFKGKKKNNFVHIESIQETENISTESKVDELQTLLIVEDNVELINYLKKELSSDYKILTANNGKKGLELTHKALPNIIITDVIMPEMNGFDLCSNIKNDIRVSHIPILMLTTKTMTDDWVEGIESGADAYMSKPFNLRILKSQLKQLTKNRKLLFNKYFSAISENSSNENTTSLDKEFIQKVLNYINDNLSDPELSVELLASELSLSRSQFYRKIKTLTGQTANGFLRKIRLQRAKIMIEKGNTNISDVCYRSGFSSPSYFTKCFKKHFNILPTEVKLNDDGELKI
ncbi:Signal transduction histidine kinase [Lutibacter oricola]|uniref:histidine kinase n=2 Tax=Lutibacter oricola TaxID=762486 RepID=A0A1H2VP70_9FLAO|nr:Signal transduction histidine kinase [Lutibacter oricola]